ncbi:MAG: YceI family protein [Actinomycetota bacterium]|nr:YceI family protein [Actinomycetota bacterium]
MAFSRGFERHWKLWALGVVAALLVLGVGGPYVYIHFVEGTAPAPLSLSSGATPAGGGTTTIAAAAQPGTSAAVPSASASTIDGTWNVTSGSTAGYRIKETLLGQSNTAVGRTSAVTGSIVISGSSVPTGSFSVDLTRVSSDRSQRDGQFQGRIMDTAKFPTATFALSSPMQFGAAPADGVEVAAPAVGNLSVHGVTKPVTFQVAAKRSGATIEVSGSIPIVFADYGIANPSGGPATTEDNGILEFLIELAHG